MLSIPKIPKNTGLLRQTQLLKLKVSQKYFIILMRIHYMWLFYNIVLANWPQGLCLDGDTIFGKLPQNPSSSVFGLHRLLREIFVPLAAKCSTHQLATNLSAIWCLAGSVCMVGLWGLFHWKQLSAVNQNNKIAVSFALIWKTCLFMCIACWRIGCFTHRLYK